MKEIRVDRDKCLHCLSCAMSCAVAHSPSRNLWEAVAREPVPAPRLLTVRDDCGPLVLMCRHCSKAPCEEACMAGAVTRDKQSGVVAVDRDRCVGCGMCIMVCPFGVIALEKKRRVLVKCDLCPDLDIPACVHACPTGALDFSGAGDSSGMRKKYVSRLLGKGGGQGSEICGYR